MCALRATKQSTWAWFGSHAARDAIYNLHRRPFSCKCGKSRLLLPDCKRSPSSFSIFCTSLISECSTMLHGIDSFAFIVSFMLTVSTSHFPNAFAIFLPLPFSLAVVYSRSFYRSFRSLKRKINVVFASEFVFSVLQLLRLFSFLCIALCPGEHFSRCPSKMPLLACARSTGWGTSMPFTSARMCCPSNHIILP